MEDAPQRSTTQAVVEPRLRIHGPLRPVELATSAVMGAVTVILTLVGWFFPHASAVSALGAVPLGVVAHRFRVRAVMASTVAASIVSFLVAGTGPVSGVLLCAIVGVLVGTFRRRRYGALAITAAAGLLGPVLGAAGDVLLLLFSSSRKLILDQVRNVGHGLTGFLARLGLGAVGTPVRHVVDVAVRDWWLTVVVLTALAVYGSTFMAWQVLGAILDRLAWVPTVDQLDHRDTGGPPEPLPMRLVDVGFRYPGSEDEALVGVSLQLGLGEMVAVAGPNGSGKSTLARILAGRAPSSGTVERPGGAGLGRVGGTAMILQRPETQILGVRVADDVIWGLARDVDVDVVALLASVGLAGMEERDTSTLSGGELQRLAIAGALARRPALLVSDESTAMVDAEGRRMLVELLAELPRRYPMTVLHVTHHDEEAAAADRVLRLEAGRLLPADEAGVPSRSIPAADLSSEPPATSAIDRPARTTPAGPALLEVVGVGHTYAFGTPWAHPALAGVDLRVDEGDGLLVVGGNGSGKSTLAWVLSGLLHPTDGRCLLDGRPVDEQVGRVALAFQHARLQVQRPTVRSDVKAAGGVGAEEADQALASVGLDPEALAERPIDQLSGGQLRRVALAGLLARQPRVLILDEPMAGLDTETRRSLLRLLGDLRRDRGLTLVVISHDLHGMAAVCDRRVLLEAGRLRADPSAAFAGVGAAVGPTVTDGWPA